MTIYYKSSSTCCALRRNGIVSPKQSQMEKGKSLEKELLSKISKMKAELILSAKTEKKLHEKMGKLHAE